MKEGNKPTIGDFITGVFCWSFVGMAAVGAGLFFGVIDIEGTQRPTVEPKPEVHATVGRVIDGDTIELSDGTVVRFVGVDTPETHHPTKGVQCFGPEASAYTASLLPPGTEIQLEYGAERYDVYGRTLAYVDLADGSSVQQLLLRNGYAQTLAMAPNTEAMARFEYWQSVAYEEAVGLWGICHGLPAR